MAISWTGAFSSSFFDTGNWDTNTVPGPLDDVEIPFSIVVATHNLNLDASVTIASLIVGRPTTISGGTLTVSGFTNVESEVLIESDAAANLGAVAINSTVIVTNHGIVNVGGSSVPQGDFGGGLLENLGTVNLNGELRGSLQGGTVNVLGESVVGSFASGTLLLVDGLTVNGIAEISGEATVRLSSDPFTTGYLYADGMLSVGVNSLLIDATNAGDLAAGSERLIFGAGHTLMDSFSATSYEVTGQIADFAYTLRLNGIETATNGLHLRALNDGGTGGHAIFDESASSRALTLFINSDTGRGVYRGGSTVDHLSSLLHGVDEVRATSADDALSVTAGSARMMFAGNAGNDSLTGGAGSDVLSGGTGNDSLTGNAGNDQLTSGPGVDTLIGGAGNDTYDTDGGDTIVEVTGDGTDTVRSSASLTLGANLERLILTGSSAIGGTGNSLANSITGNASANTLNGGTGVDTLIGGAGNDTYVTDGGDTIVETVGGGTDTVRSSVSMALGANVEHLVLTGAAVSGTGNGLANRITGNASANTLNGGTGADTLIGGAGNDIYITNGSDTITEAVGAGIDTVQSVVSLTLAANLDRLVLTGTGAMNGTGNILANTITGNASANMLNGRGGADKLLGGGGADRLIGGSGNDTMTGGAGADDFVFVAGSGRDRITDFVAKGSRSDDIDFSDHSRIVSFADLKANHMTASGTNVLIKSGTDVITLVNVRLGDLDASDFIF